MEIIAPWIHVRKSQEKLFFNYSFNYYFSLLFLLSTLKSLFVTSQPGKKSNKREKCDRKPSGTFHTLQLWDKFTGMHAKKVFSLVEKARSSKTVFYVTPCQQTDKTNYFMMGKNLAVRFLCESYFPLYCSLLDLFLKIKTLRAWRESNHPNKSDS